MNNNIKIHTPLFTIFKRDDLSKSKALLIRVLSFVFTFLFAVFLCFIIIKENYFKILGTIFTGAFAMPWKLLLDTSLLLAFGIAIVPTFKMKYWNMGANGQVIIGALVAIILMFYLDGFASKNSINNILLIFIMLFGSIMASVIWAVIPAIFKVLFNTNETLFTLMMNYIAIGLVSYANFIMTKGQKESVGIINSYTESGYFPVLMNKYFLPILIIIVLTILIYIYMNKTKHGYEVIVVGDSINTAKYVGMNTKKIIIRTLVLCGIICGIIGFLYASAINQSINKDMCGSLGFTAVLVAWLSNFNPLTMAGVCFLLIFITNGTSKVSSVYRLGSNNLSSVIIGLIFFSILISEFFIRFRVVIRKKNKMGGQM